MQVQGTSLRTGSLPARAIGSRCWSTERLHCRASPPQCGPPSAPWSSRAGSSAQSSNSPRDMDREALVELLRQTAERAVEALRLFWASAPEPLFRPGRRQVEAVIAELADGTGVRAATDRRERPMHLVITRSS